MFIVIYKNEIIPSMKWKIRNIVEVDIDGISYHAHCPNCRKYLKKFDKADFEIICECEKIINQKNCKFYVSIDFEDQLENLIETQYKKKIFYFQSDRNKVNGDVTEDVCDGYEYKRLQQENKPLTHILNYSYTFDSDGIKPSFASSTTLWPSYGYINELKLNVRFKNIFLLGIRVDNQELDVITFFQPFVDKANLLSEEGLSYGKEKKVMALIVYAIVW